MVGSVGSSVEGCSVVGPVVVVPEVGSSVGPSEAQPIWELRHCWQAAVFWDGHSIDTLNFGQLGHILGQSQYWGTTSSDMSQNSKHDLRQVLGLIVGRQKMSIELHPWEGHSVKSQQLAPPSKV